MRPITLCVMMQVLSRTQGASRSGERQHLEALSMARALVRHHEEVALPCLRRLVLGALPGGDDQRPGIARATVGLYKVFYL